MRTKLCIVGVVTLLATLVGASPGGAVAASGGTPSTLGAGYLQSPPSGTGVTVGEVEVRVPEITSCASSTDVESLWLGVEAYEGTGGTGNDDLYAQVLADCIDGEIAYSAVANTPGGTQQTASVTPGEVVDVYIRDSSSGSVVDAYEIHKPFDTELLSEVGNAPTNGTGAEGSVLVGQQDLTTKIPKFTDLVTGKNAVYFVHSYVNGYELGFDGYPTQELIQANDHIELSTSAISGAGGYNFHLIYHSHF
jgi:hypothetical protein